MKNLVVSRFLRKPDIRPYMYDDKTWKNRTLIKLLKNIFRYFSPNWLGIINFDIMLEKITFPE